MDVALSIQMAKALRLRNIYLYLFIFNNNLLYLFRNINICLCMFLMHLTRIFRTQQQIDDPQPGSLSDVLLEPPIHGKRFVYLMSFYNNILINSKF